MLNSAGQGCKRRQYGRGILQSQSPDGLIGVSFCLPHHVAVNAFIICSSVCASTEMV